MIRYSYSNATDVLVALYCTSHRGVLTSCHSTLGDSRMMLVSVRRRLCRMVPALDPAATQQEP